MTIEYFEQIGGTILTPRITISRDGQIYLNSRAAKKFLSDERQYIRLGFDKETKDVIIEVSKQELPYSTPRLLTKNWNMAVRKFLQHIGYDYKSKARHFPATIDDKKISFNINKNC